MKCCECGSRVARKVKFSLYISSPVNYTINFLKVFLGWGTNPGAL
jgi:hypothetical protein